VARLAEARTGERPSTTGYQVPGLLRLATRTTSASAMVSSLSMVRCGMGTEMGRL
jgi:hypothetical protein